MKYWHTCQKHGWYNTQSECPICRNPDDKVFGIDYSGPVSFDRVKPFDIDKTLQNYNDHVKAATYDGDFFDALRYLHGTKFPGGDYKSDQDRMFEANPEAYHKMKDDLVRASRLYEAPKDDVPAFFDNDPWEA